VQVTVDAAWAGVMLTEAPDSQSLVAIEAAPGLGEVVVGGRVTPEGFRIDRTTHQIVQARAGHQEFQLVLGAGGVQRAAVAKDGAGRDALSPGVLAELTRLGLTIEAHYGCAQDIEWVVARDGGLWIVQTRPITARRPAGLPPAPPAARDRWRTAPASAIPAPKRAPAAARPSSTSSTSIIWTIATR